MRALIQRVERASVRVDEQTVGEIGGGLLILAGFEADDSPEDSLWAVRKLIRLRIFSDSDGVMNRSVIDTGGELLAVSQFTLFASIRKGSRPSWGRAAAPEIARPLFDQFVTTLSYEAARPVAQGVFGTDMRVELINDGPVTLMIDSRARD